MELRNEKRTQLNTLLFQLSELIKDPPTILDHYDWISNLSYVMQEIHDISDEAYEKLDDLVLETQRRGEEHVRDIDADEPPSVVSRSAERYFEQVSYTTSEINTLKAF